MYCIYIRNYRGLDIEPWGTSQLTFNGEEGVSFITT